MLMAHGSQLALASLAVAHGSQLALASLAVAHGSQLAHASLAVGPLLCYFLWPSVSSSGKWSPLDGAVG